jgi:uncharacterized protein (DUF1778 family)
LTPLEFPPSSWPERSSAVVRRPVGTRAGSAGSCRAESECEPGRLVAPYDVRTLLDMRTQRLELRLTDEERTIDQAAATAVGESLSDFFRRAAANRAADILADERTITLTEDEAIRFLDALETVDDHAVARLADLRART